MRNKLLKVKQAAKFLGISEIQLRKLINEDIIPYVNISTTKVRSLRIEAQALKDFVEKGGTHE